MTGKDDVHIYADIAALAHAVAERWEEIAQAAIALRGVYHVALAGGATPRVLYGLLASPEWRNRIDWQATHIYFGDERCVPPDHPDSNFRMAHAALLAHVDISPGHIHRMEGERDPEAAARAYAGVLREYLPRSDTGSQPPRFDLLLLGLGPDGHIASLFPNTPILAESEKWVAASYVERLRVWRISLTYPMLNAARRTAVMVAGENKAGIVQTVLGGGGWRTEPYPVERLRPSGRMEWFLDHAAAAGLETGIGKKD